MGVFVYIQHMVQVLHLLLCALLSIRIIPASEEVLGPWTHTPTHTQLLTLPSLKRVTKCLMP